MADNDQENNQQPQTATASGKGMKYYRCREASALTVIVGPPVEGGVVPQTVRFAPFEERYEGEAVKVGYLATDNKRAIQLLKEDSSVEEIDEEEFVSRTDPENNPKVKPLPL